MIFNNFKSGESGAVTVDWVVLTAAIIGLVMVAMTQIWATDPKPNPAPAVTSSAGN